MNAIRLAEGLKMSWEWVEEEKGSSQEELVQDTHSSGHPSFCSEAQHSFWYKESTKLADENDLLIGNRATTKTEHNFYKKKFFPPNWENKLSRNSYQ